MSYSKKSTIGLLLLLLISLTIFFSGCGENASAEISTTAAQEPPTQTTAANQQRNVETILMMGLDKAERMEDKRAYVNDIRCDFLLLIVVDKDAKTIRSLHINRDTMTDITRLGVFGGATGKYVGQIALAYSYGSGGSDSALNAVRAVSNLLGGKKIDHYMTFTMDSVPIVNDMVGGVTVLVEDDFSEYDPTLVQGQEITLMGEQALHFVRGRMNVADGTNLNRMARQRQYMTSLYEKVMAAASQDETFAEKMVKKLSDNFDTDLSLNQLQSLFDELMGCTMEEILTLDGEIVRGDNFMEFYPTQDSISKAMEKLYS